MSVQNETTRVQYIAASGETNFGFPFKIFVDEDIQVYLTPVGSLPDPITDILILNVDYTVTILDQSGSITLIVPATLNDIITIERDIPSTRTFDYGIGGNFSGDSIDTQLDKITMEIAQNKSRQLKRGLTYEVTEQLTNGDLSLPKLSPNHYWIKNDSGNLVGAACTDNDGCSTLRSELISETIIAPGTDNVGYNDDVDGPQTLTEKLKNISPQKDNRAIVKNTIDETKLVRIDASQISTGTTRTIFMPDGDINLGISTPKGYVYGCGIEQDIGDTAHDIKINSGHVHSENSDITMNLSSSIVKQVDANWTEGTNQGGFPSTLTLSIGYYYIFIISKEDGTTDAGYDNSIDASNLLLDTTDYLYYRRIGQVYVNNTLDFWDFKQFVDNQKRTYHWIPTWLVNSYTNPGTSDVLVDMWAPANVTTIQMFNYLLYQSGTDHDYGIYFSCPDIPSEAASRTSTPLCSLTMQQTTSSSEHYASYAEIRADSSGRIRFRLSNSFSNTNVKIAGLGYIEYL